LAPEPGKLSASWGGRCPGWFHDEEFIMKYYRCGQCKKMRDEAIDGCHHAWVADLPENYRVCDSCYPEVLAAHCRGTIELFGVDGKDLGIGHFVCPECLAVKPKAELVEYATSEPPAPNHGYMCSACQPVVFRRAKDQGFRAWVVAWL
jgi:hypothetical protein